MSLTADTLVVKEATYQTVLVLSIESIKRLEVRRGRGIMGRYWMPVSVREVLSIAPGTRLRVRQSASGQPASWLAGAVVVLDADTLVLKTDRSAKTVAIPRAAIAALNVSTGKSRERGALIGAAIGFVAGNLYFKVINPPDYRCIAEREGGDCDTLFFFFRDGITGAPFGALAGLLLFAEDRWEPVSLALSVGFSPHGGRVALRHEFGR